MISCKSKPACFSPALSQVFISFFLQALWSFVLNHSCCLNVCLCFFSPPEENPVRTALSASQIIVGPPGPSGPTGPSGTNIINISIRPVVREHTVHETCVSIISYVMIEVWPLIMWVLGRVHHYKGLLCRQALLKTTKPPKITNMSWQFTR